MAAPRQPRDLGAAAAAVRPASDRARPAARRSPRAIWVTRSAYVRHGRTPPYWYSVVWYRSGHYRLQLRRFFADEEFHCSTSTAASPSGLPARSAARARRRPSGLRCGRSWSADRGRAAPRGRDPLRAGARRAARGQPGDRPPGHRRPGRGRRARAGARQGHLRHRSADRLPPAPHLVLPGDARSGAAARDGRAVGQRGAGRRRRLVRAADPSGPAGGPGGAAADRRRHADGVRGRLLPLGAVPRVCCSASSAPSTTSSPASTGWS